VDGLRVSRIHGEAVYWQGSPGHADVKFTNNHVFDCAFNGLNFNAHASNGFLIANNYVQNCWQGIEQSTGQAINNTMVNCYRGMLTGAGGGGPVHLRHNEVIGGTWAYDISFDAGAAAKEVLQIHNNIARGINAGGFVLSNVSAFQFKDNLVYAHANSINSYAYSFGANTSFGHIDGNITRGAGPFSAGAVNNSGTTNVVGTNPVF
jgi:hypothetical protein